MNRNVLIVMAGAVLVAVLVAILVQVLMAPEPQPVQTVQEEPRVEVLIAARDLGMGHELAEGDLRWQEWPESSIFPGAVVRKDDQIAVEALAGRLARDIAAGEPVGKMALLGNTSGNIVAANLRPGMRAISVEVDASSMVSGFVGPGDFVDIILTYRERLPSEAQDPAVKSRLALSLNKMATETILQNIKVLAVDQTATRPEEDKIKVGRTVTLAVNVEQAEKLALAAEMGDLMFVLRGVGDDTVVEKKWPTVTDSRITNIDDEIFNEYESLKKGSGLQPNMVRIYNGSIVQDVPAK